MDIPAYRTIWLQVSSVSVYSETQGALLQLDTKGGQRVFLPKSAADWTGETTLFRIQQALRKWMEDESVWVQFRIGEGSGPKLSSPEPTSLPQYKIHISLHVRPKDFKPTPFKA